MGKNNDEWIMVRMDRDGSETQRQKAKWQRDEVEATRVCCSLLTKSFTRRSSCDPMPEAASIKTPTSVQDGRDPCQCGEVIRYPDLSCVETRSCIKVGVLIASAKHPAT